MILLLHGGDGLALRRRMQQLRDQADGGSGMLVTNLAEVDGRDAKPHHILGPAMSPPFLAPYRLVVVEKLLDRFEQPRGEMRAPRSVEPWAPLFAAIEAGLPETTILVFTAAKLEKRNPLLDRLAKLPGVTNEEHAQPNERDAPRYIRDEAAARGIRFRPGPSKRPHFDSEAWVSGGAGDPAVLLGALTRADTLRIASELDKLALFAQGREVTVDDVYDVCAGEREMSGFRFTDSVMDGKHLDALTALQLLRREGESTQGLLGLLTGAYRRLGTVLGHLETGATPEDVGRAMRMPWPNLRDAAIRRARRLGPEGLATAYEALVEADRRPKLGEIDEDLALELLVAKLTRYRPAAPAARRSA